MSEPKSIKIRYNEQTSAGNEPPAESPAPTKGKRKQTPAQKEALEKARQALLEKKQKEKEAKAKLKEQEKDIDNVILANASRGQELRKRMAELQKELEEIEQPPQPTQDLPQPPHPDQPSEVKVVSQIRGKTGKGRKVILIDASIFDSDEEEEEVQPVKRIRGRRPLKEPRRRADRRTRFRRDPDLVYSDDEDYEDERPLYDEHEPEQKYGFRGMRHIPEEQDYPDDNIRTTFDQINRGVGSRSEPSVPLRHPLRADGLSATVQPPPPIRNQGVAMEQIKNENPLARMIFG